MMYILTADEMREMDRQTIETFGLPGRVLMENAGRGATRAIFQTWPDVYTKSVAVFAGKGNNGGDGFVIARYLAQHGVDVTVYLLAGRDRLKGNAADNFKHLETLGITVTEMPDELTFSRYKSQIACSGLVVDAVLGTGLESEVKGYYANVIDFMNNLKAPVFSVDIPSGLASDTGNPCGICIKADATATFAFAKLGHMLLPGADYTGKLFIVDIGIPPHIVKSAKPAHKLLTAELIKSLVPMRSSLAHKGQTGHVLVAAGSTGKTGAAVMAATAAMRAGAGLVTLAVPESINNVVETRALEVMTRPFAESEKGVLGKNSLEEILSMAKDKACLALGPGLTTAGTTRELVCGLIQNSPVPVVADADALNILASDPEVMHKRRSELILTPHPGEMSRLAKISTAEIQADRISAAKNFAEKNKIHLVLKGARTIIAHPDGSVFVNPTGNPGMASGGMGDVLTGMIAGFLAQGVSETHACHLGVYLHGAAGDMLAQSKGAFGYLAGELMDHLPETLNALISGSFTDTAHDCRPML
jgi:NAD(P)H-hydrate epimerase